MLNMVRLAKDSFYAVKNCNRDHEMQCFAVDGALKYMYITQFIGNRRFFQIMPHKLCGWFYAHPKSMRGIGGAFTRVGYGDS